MERTTKTNKKRFGLAAVLTLSLLAAAACDNTGGDAGYPGDGTAESADREVIKKPGKTITIVDTKTEPKQEAIEVSKIDVVEGLRGTDWVSEDKILVAKDNPNAKQITIEGEKRYPINIYIHDLTGAVKEDEPLKEESANQTFARMSPDLKHVFYNKNEEDTAHGYIMNMDTRESVTTGEGVMHAGNGEWIDSERVLFNLIPGSIVSANVNGGTETVLPLKSFAVGSVALRDNTLYYIDKEVLYAYDTQLMKNPRPLAERVLSFIPSPDGKQFAIVKRTTETEMELTVTDPQLNKKYSLAGGLQVFGIGWSPDGSKIAYTLTPQEQQGVTGVFVADAISGMSTQISVETQLGASDPLRFSPSGDKLMITSGKLENNRFVPSTYIVSF